MDFDLSEDQKEIKSTARSLLTARSPWASVRAAAEGAGYDQALWKELGELGWPGIAVAEEHGGQGLGQVELTVLLEELGYALASTPFLGTAAAAAAIQAAGTPEQQARWLPGLASGEATGSVGTADLAVDAVGASVFVLLGDDGAIVLDAGDADVTPLTLIDTTRTHGSVAGEGEALGGDAAERVRVAVAAEVVGVCQRALDMTVAYVKDRKQFDTPVGAFQSVSHRCAQMLFDTESARSATLYASWAADASGDVFPEAAALAAAAASSAGRDVTASAIQAHGGIGFTWEADVHWMYKRTQLQTQLLGGARRHRATLARLGAARVAATTA